MRFVLLLLLMLVAPTAFGQQESLVDTVKAAHAKVNTALSRREVEQRRLEQAEQARDAKAAQVQRLKLSGAADAEVAKVLRAALVLDESVSLQRGHLASANGEVAQSGAQLLSLYDQLLLRKRTEAERASSRSGQQRALRAYRVLSRRRDELRRLLQPALRSGDTPKTVEAESAWLRAVRADDEDDVETLLEKADLARDLEERYLRRAAAVRRRIRELEQERALAKDVLGLSRAQGLFDENDRRLQAGVAVQERRLGGGGGIPMAAADAAGAEQENAAAPAPTTGDEVALSSAGENSSDATDQAPPPSADPSAGFDNSDDGLGADADVEVDVGGGAGRGDVSGPTAVMVQTSAVPVVNEEVFVNLDLRDHELEQMLNDESLSLKQLKALERKLQRRARSMQKQSDTLQSTAEQR